LLKLLKI